MQEARALVRRRLPPRPGEPGARRLDGAVDVCLAGRRDAGERLARRGLGQLAGLAGGGLGALAADEEAVLARRDSHRLDPSEFPAAARRAEKAAWTKAFRSKPRASRIATAC